ncbi:MAG: redoxin domain-containing protein [Bacteroidales bacterium]
MKEKLNSKLIKRQAYSILTLLLFAFLPISLLSQQSYDITFKIRDIEDNDIIIKSYYGKDVIVHDTLKQREDGSFHFLKDSINKGIGIVAVDKYEIFTFLFDKSNKFEIEMDGDWNYVVNGCMDNDLYFEFQKANTQLRRLEKSIRKTFKESKEANKDSLETVFLKESKAFVSFQTEFYKNYPNHLMSKLVNVFEDITIPKDYLIDNKLDTSKLREFAYYYRTHYWDKFDFSDQRFIGTPYFFKKLQTFMTEITYQKGDSIGEAIKDFVVLARKKNGEIYAKYIVDYYIKSYRNVPFSYSEDRFVAIVDRAINYETTPWLSISEIQALRMEADKLRPLLPNQKFKNITEKDFDGKTHSLYDLENKYTIVYFWSPECESCKINLDILEKFYNEYKNVYDVEVFSIDLDNNLEQSLKFRKAHPFKWIVLKTTPEELQKKYNLDIEMTPDLYILDKDKRIINHTPSYNQIEETIKRMEEKQ